MKPPIKEGAKIHWLDLDGELDDDALDLAREARFTDGVGLAKVKEK